MINAVTDEIVEVANMCAESFASNISEFDVSGLTPVLASCSAPHVVQSPVRLERKVVSETQIGDGGPGAGSIVIAAIVRAFVDKRVYRGMGQIDVAALRLIGRSSVDQYLVADGLFTIARPATGDPGV